jgi:hypothetical protein
MMTKQFMHPVSLLAGAAGLYLTTFAASAALITIDTISANWMNVVGGSNVNFVDSDGITGNEELRWGTTADTQSGYRFDSSAPPSFDVNTDMAFTLGDFIHFNFPINLGSAISSAQLDITTDLQIDGNSLLGGPYTFSFLHNETSNACSPQPGCANDLVSFSNLAGSDTFMIDSDEYTLELLGFQQGGTTATSFSTLEGQENVAQLQVIFRTLTTATAVPEPGLIALFGLGLLAMGITRKRV